MLDIEPGDAVMLCAVAVSLLAVYVPSTDVAIALIWLSALLALLGLFWEELVPRFPRF